MKSQWFTNRARYDFGKLLQESDYARRHDESFHSFLVMASCSLQQATFALAGQCSVAVEREYMTEVKRVKHPNKLAEAFNVLVGSLTEKPEDFLGSVYFCSVHMHRAVDCRAEPWASGSEFRIGDAAILKRIRVICQNPPQ